MAISTDDIEDMPHVVIVLSPGKVTKVRDFKTGTEAGYYAQAVAANDEEAEITVCLLVRKLGTVSEGDLTKVGN